MFFQEHGRVSPLESSLDSAFFFSIAQSIIQTITIGMKIKDKYKIHAIPSFTASFRFQSKTGWHTTKTVTYLFVKSILSDQIRKYFSMLME